MGHEWLFTQFQYELLFSVKFNNSLIVEIAEHPQLLMTSVRMTQVCVSQKGAPKSIIFSLLDFL